MEGCLSGYTLLGDVCLPNDEQPKTFYHIQDLSKVVWQYRSSNNLFSFANKFIFLVIFLFVALLSTIFLTAY